MAVNILLLKIFVLRVQFFCISDLNSKNFVTLRYAVLRDIVCVHADPSECVVWCLCHAVQGAWSNGTWSVSGL